MAAIIEHQHYAGFKRREKWNDPKFVMHLKTTCHKIFAASRVELAATLQWKKRTLLFDWLLSTCKACTLFVRDCFIETNTTSYMYAKQNNESKMFVISTTEPQFDVFSQIKCLLHCNIVACWCPVYIFVL